MLTLTIALCTLATVLRLAAIAERALVRKWDADRTTLDRLDDRRLDLEQRRVVLAERELALKERTQEKPAKPEPMPPDLVARCQAWEDPWAQEEERGTLLGLYAELGDWDRVRAKLAPLTPLMSMPDLSVMQ